MEKKTKKIYGYKMTLKKIDRFIEYVNNAEEYEKQGLRVPHTIGIFGPSGTGKTTMAEYILSKVNCQTYRFEPSSNSMSGKDLNSIFEKLKSKKKSILLIDELDSIYEKGDSFETVILKKLDYVANHNNIFIIMCGMNVDRLPYPILRKGRTDFYIKLGGNYNIVCCGIIDEYLAERKVDKELNGNIVLDIYGYQDSISDILYYLDMACDYSKKHHHNELLLSDVKDSYKEETFTYEVPPSCNLSYMAVHEAGHAIVSLVYNKVFELRVISIDKDRNNGCYNTNLNLIDEINYGLKEVLIKVAILLGSYAANKIILGEAKNGVEGDLLEAKRTIYHALVVGGLDSLKDTRFRNLDTQNSKRVSDKRYDEINKKVDHYVDVAYKMAYDAINNNNDAAFEIIKLLTANTTLYQPDFKKIKINRDYLKPKDSIKKEVGCVGIFFLINKDLYCHGEKLTNAYNNGDNINSLLGHLDYFDQLVGDTKEISPLKSDNYATYPRGRIVYNIKDKKFKIYTNIMIFKDKKLKEKIIQAFHLEKSKYEFLLDKHYETKDVIDI